MNLSSEHQLLNDFPLQPGNAKKNDELGRYSFASSVAETIRKVHSKNGFVISIEGAWGSGKTSTLALIEEVLMEQDKNTLIVEFNPWLIGDRNALLRLFLIKIATEISLKDFGDKGQKVAEEITKYAKILDIAKFVPGVEPLATILKQIISSTAEIVAPTDTDDDTDIESQKNKLRDALVSFEKPIVVFIDDIDRLFPLEIFEMVRIIKAIGDLPNITYVVAWDANYVQQALNSASIPESQTYLDKIVQLRIPLPSLSTSAKETLINKSLSALPEEAKKDYFPNTNYRLSKLYYHGLQELIEQPRDIIRIFNTVALIEPILREEIVLSDIIGLSTIIIKAPDIFNLLKMNPHWFVGLEQNKNNIEDDVRNNIQVGKEKIDYICKTSFKANSLWKLITFLFPLLEDFNYYHTSKSELKGLLADPDRLYIALQLSLNEFDVSLKLVRQFINFPELRNDILDTLTRENCFEFLNSLNDEIHDTSSIKNKSNLCLTLAQIVDKEPFRTRHKNRRSVIQMPLIWFINGIIITLIGSEDSHTITNTSSAIVKDKNSLTMAADIISKDFLSNKSDKDTLYLATDERDELINAWSKNVLETAKSNTLFNRTSPNLILWTLAVHSPDVCSKVFKYCKEKDSTLDSFIVSILEKGYDSYKGQIYAHEKDDESKLIAYCPLDELIRRGRKRLKDTQLTYPTKAAWQALVECKAFYGIDGSPAEILRGK